MSKLGRQIIDQAERLAQLRHRPFEDSLVPMLTYLADLESLIGQYRSVERALLQNKTSLDREQKDRDYQEAFESFKRGHSQ